MSSPKGYTELGRLGKTFQLEGGLRFYPLGKAEREAVFNLETVFINALGELSLQRVREVGKHLVIYLQGIHSLEKAKPLVGTQVYAELQGLEQSGDYYLDKLLGLAVFVEKTLLGKVSSVIEGGGHDILDIETQTGNVLLPLNAPYVRVSEEGIFVTDAPEGLIDLNA